MDVNKLLQVSTFAGKIMLESGAEIYRVEETICRICLAFGVNSVDSFATPTGIMVSILNDGNTYSLVKRVTSRGVDLNKIDKVNSLSRQLQTEIMEIDELNKCLLDIQNGDNYSLLTKLAFSSLSAGMFSIVFGGDIKDAFSAAIIGIVIRSLLIKFEKLYINTFFINTICGAITSALSIVLFILGIANHVDTTNIGAIMLLVPGLAITNAVRDTIAGDYLSGITKAAEAFLIAIAIAVGSGSILSLWINTFGGTV